MGQTRSLTLTILSLAALHACDAQQDPVELPYASTYSALPSAPFILRGATLLTGTGEKIDDGDVLVRDGKIIAVGSSIDAQGAQEINAAEAWITPGVIDVHSHIGAFAMGGGGGNEATAPSTPHVWVEHSVWPQDPGFVAALAGGVTSLQILPGSANLIGGRGVTLKNVPGRSVMDMKFPGAPYGLKMACGENPKGLYGGKGREPSTNMGNVAGYRAAWIAAVDYRNKRSKTNSNGGDPGLRDLGLETLSGVLNGDILVHNHCYKADEMAIMLEIAEEFDYKITAFHHAVEAYKIADVLRDQDVCAAIWADWWGFKMESFDGIRDNAAILDKVGACVVMHSDSAMGIQRLNQESAKVIGAAARAGIEIPPERAIRWITSNAAKSLGINDQVGTLEAGKMADITVWSGNPFSVYTRAQQVYIDGALVFDRDNPDQNPVTDFSLGNSAQHGGAQ